LFSNFIFGSVELFSSHIKNSFNTSVLFISSLSLYINIKLGNKKLGKVEKFLKKSLTGHLAAGILFSR
jgi:hypothetical protein